MQYIKAYHLSPHSNIRHFSGCYSPKMHDYGLFICPSWSSILNDWMGTIITKRFGRRKPSTLKKRQRRLDKKLDTLEENSQEYEAFLNLKYRCHQDVGSYRNITIYSLKLPINIYLLCKQKHEDLCSNAFKLQGVKALGAWAWGEEVFIASEYLDQIQIIKRKTVTYRQAIKLSTINRLNQITQEENIRQKMKIYQEEIEQLIRYFGRAPLLDRAQRYAINLNNIVIKDNTRHYRVIESFLKPYRKLLLNKRDQIDTKF